jgi:hypothetical protein
MSKHGLNYRHAEVSRVMQCWQGSESCALVGVGSIGKSNLLRHLADEAVQAHFLQTDAQTFKAINIDPNMLAPLPGDASSEAVRVWSGFELMMHRLFLSFYPFDVLSPTEAKQFYEVYQTLQDGSNPLYASMGVRYFELGLAFFLRRGIRIVFMFDEFEEMLRQLPVRFFQSLRGLRDQHKSQLSYLTFTRAPIDTIAQRVGIPPLDIEPFRELFNDNTVFVGPYTYDDARAMLDELCQRRNLELSDPSREFAIEVTGGFAGLLRAVTQPLASLPQSGEWDTTRRRALVQTLARRANIAAECRTIWDSLSVAEQIVLMAIARLTPYAIDGDSEMAISLLVQKKLVRVDRKSNELSIMPPLFDTFVRESQTL